MTAQDPVLAVGEGKLNQMFLNFQYRGRPEVARENKIMINHLFPSKIIVEKWNNLKL